MTLAKVAAWHRSQAAYYEQMTNRSTAAPKSVKMTWMQMAAMHQAMAEVLTNG